MSRDQSEVNKANVNNDSNDHSPAHSMGTKQFLTHQQSPIGSVQRLVTDNVASDPKLLSAQNQYLTLQLAREETYQEIEQSAARFNEMLRNMDSNKQVTSPTELQQQFAACDDKFEKYGLLLSNGSDKNGGNLSQMTHNQGNQANFRTVQNHHSNMDMQQHTLPKSPSGRITGNNLQQFQNNPKLLMLQMYETAQKQKRELYLKRNLQLHQTEIRSGESKPMQFLNSNSQNQMDQMPLFNTQDMNTFVNSRRLLSNVSISPSRIQEQPLPLNQLKLMPKINSTDQMHMNQTSPLSHFWKGGSKNGSNHFSQDRFSLNNSQLQQVEERQNDHKRHTTHASQSSIQNSANMNRDAIYINTQQMLAKQGSTHSGVAKGAIGPMPSNTSLNGVGVKFSKRKEKETKNQINKRIQAQLSPKAQKSNGFDKQSTYRKSFVHGWNKRGSTHKLGSPDLDHISRYNPNKANETLNEFFDTKSALTKSLLNADKPSIQIQNEEAQINNSQTEEKSKKTGNNQRLETIVGAPSSQDGEIKNSEFNRDKSKEAKSVLKKQQQDSTNLEQILQKNNKNSMDDGIQSGFQNLSHNQIQDNMPNDVNKEALNNTMSSITGGGKEYKPDDDPQMQTVTNGFKITDTNFMTMRENRMFRLQGGKNNLPEPQYENRDLQSPFKMADLNVTTMSKFAKRKMTLEQKSTMNISNNLLVHDQIKNIGGQTGGQQTKMERPHIIKNDSIEIITSQNKTQDFKGKIEIKKLKQFDHSAHYDPSVLRSRTNDPVKAEEHKVINQAVHQNKEFMSMQNRFGHHRMSNSHIATNKRSQKSIGKEGEEKPNNGQPSALTQEKFNRFSRMPSIPQSEIQSKFNITRQTSFNNSKWGHTHTLTHTLYSKLGQIQREGLEEPVQKQIQERLLASPLKGRKLESNVPKRQAKRPRKYDQNGALIEDGQEIIKGNLNLQNNSQEKYNEYSFRGPSTTKNRKQKGLHLPDRGVIIMDRQPGDSDKRLDTTPISTKYGAQTTQKRHLENQNSKTKPRQISDREHSSQKHKDNYDFKKSFYSSKTNQKKKKNRAHVSPSLRAQRMNQDLEREFSRSTFEGHRHQILARSSLSKLSQQNQEDDDRTLEKKYDSLRSSTREKPKRDAGDRQRMNSDDIMNQTFQSPPGSHQGSVLDSLNPDKQADETMAQQQELYGTITDMKLRIQKVGSKTAIGKKEGVNQMNDTSHSIFVIPPGVQLTSLNDGTPMPRFNLLGARANVTEQPSGYDVDKNNAGTEELGSSENDKVTPISPMRIPNVEMNQMKIVDYKHHDHSTLDEQELRLPDYDGNKQILNKNFNTLGEHLSLKDEVYIDQNDEFDDIEDKQQVRVEQIGENYNIVSSSVIPPEAQRAKDLIEEQDQEAMMNDKEMDQQLQNQLSQIPIVQMAIEGKPYIQLNAIQDFDSQRESTLLNAELTHSPRAEGKKPMNSLQESPSFHRARESTQGLSVINEKVNKTQKNSPKNVNHKMLKIIASRDQLNNLMNNQDPISPSQISQSPSPDMSPHKRKTNKERRDMNLNEMLFYTTQKMSIKGSPTSLSHKKEQRPREANEDLKMSQHDLNKIQKVKNIKISFAHRGGSFSNQIQQNFVQPFKVPSPLSHNQTDQHGNPFRQREPSPEDLEMRKNLYGNTQSREKLHKFIEEQSKKKLETLDKEEQSKAPLRINNIDLKPLGNQQTVFAKQRKNREILNQMDQIREQGLLAPSSMLHNNSRILLQQQRHMNKQPKQMTLDTHKKKFMRNFKSLNNSNRPMNRVPSINNLPEDINETLRRNGIMLTTMSRTMIKQGSNLGSQKNVKMADETNNHFLSTKQTSQPPTSMNVTKEKSFAGLNTITPGDAPRLNLTTRISPNDTQNISFRDNNRTENSRLKQKKSRLREQQAPFLQTSQARINVLNMSMLNQRIAKSHEKSPSNIQSKGASAYPMMPGLNNNQLIRTLNMIDSNQLQNQEKLSSHIKIKEFKERKKSVMADPQQQLRATSNVMAKASESFMHLDPVKGKQFSSRYKRNSVGGFIHFSSKEKPLIMPAIFSNQKIVDTTDGKPNEIGLNMKEGELQLTSLLQSDEVDENMDLQFKYQNSQMPSHDHVVVKELPKTRKKFALEVRKKKKKDNTGAPEGNSFLPKIY